MVKYLFKILLPGIVGLCTACNTYDFGGMISAGSSVQHRFRVSMDDANTGYHPDVLQGGDGYSFLIASDMHIRQDQWPRVDRFFTLANDGSSLMTLLLGDFMYDAGSSLAGLTESILAHEGLHVFPAIGNHDVYKDGYDRYYRQTFGPTVYAFRVETASGTDLFIALDSANGTLGVDQADWLRGVLSRERALCRHCFIFTHANFFAPASYPDVVSTYPIEEMMMLLDLFARHRVTAVFSGHSHEHDDTTVRGVRYVTLDPWLERKQGSEYCRAECRANGSVKLFFEKFR